MDSERENSIFPNINNKFKKNKIFQYLNKLFIILIISFILIYIILNIGIFNFSIKSNEKWENKFLKLERDLNKTLLILKELMKIKNKEIGEFNGYINEEYIQKQKTFCKNINDNYNDEFENKIKLVNVKFDNLTYNMFVYKKSDCVSNYISKYKIWEKHEAHNVISGLNFYSNKKNLINKEIYIIDIGGNIGWYTFLLGKFGYNLITFEPSKINFYILNKNYCLNKEINVTLINKGLFTEDKRCYIFSPKNNIGNGLINCTEKADSNKINNGEIILTKLSNYISFFENRNLALIKMDIEGSEGKAFESGIELIIIF